MNDVERSADARRGHRAGRARRHHLDRARLPTCRVNPCVPAEWDLLVGNEEHSLVRVRHDLLHALRYEARLRPVRRQRTDRRAQGQAALRQVQEAYAGSNRARSGVATRDRRASADHPCPGGGGLRAPVDDRGAPTTSVSKAGKPMYVASGVPHQPILPLGRDAVAMAYRCDLARHEAPAHEAHEGPVHPAREFEHRPVVALVRARDDRPRRHRGSRLPDSRGPYAPRGIRTSQRGARTCLGVVRRRAPALQATLPLLRHFAITHFDATSTHRSRLVLSVPHAHTASGRWAITPHPAQHRRPAHLPAITFTHPTPGTITIGRTRRRRGLRTVPTSPTVTPVSDIREAHVFACQPRRE